MTTSAETKTLDDFVKSNDKSVSINTPHLSPDKIMTSSSLQSCNTQNNMLLVMIESTVQEPTTFRVPLVLMLQREIEMKATARTNRIDSARWTSSLLFRLWKQKQNLMLPQHEKEVGVVEDGDVILRINPVSTFSDSTSFHWKEWLSTCIQNYYYNGNLRIPDECTGDDILLSLDYFGILAASENDFVFDSRHAFYRIQYWSRFFTNRVHLSETLLKEFYDSEVMGFEISTWILLRQDDDYQDEAALCTQYRTSCQISRNGSSTLHAKSIRKLKIEDNLYDLFYGNQYSNNQSTCETNEKKIEKDAITQCTFSRIRHSFCLFMMQSLPQSEIRFTVERVEMISGRIETRPVIHIERNHNESDRHEYFPDELQQKNTTVSKHQSMKRTKAFNMENSIGYSNSSPNKKYSTQDRNVVPTDSSQSETALLDIESDINNFYNIKKLGATSISKADQSRLRTQSDIQHTSRQDDTKPSSLLQIDRAASNAENDSWVKLMTKPKSSKMKNVDNANRCKTPIKLINTELGDLRSVTSVLSVPTVRDEVIVSELYSKSDLTSMKNRKYDQAKKIIRERCTGALTKFGLETGRNVSEINDQAAKISQESTCSETLNTQLKSPPRTTKNLASTPPWSKGQQSANSEGIKLGSSEVPENESNGSDFLGNDSVEDNLDAQPFMVQFISSMCESLIPSQSRNRASNSPIRRFTVSTTKSRSSSASLSDDNHHRQTFRVSHFREGTKSSRKCTKFVDEAQNKFDELLKAAYNGSRKEETDDCLSQNERELPEILSMHTTEDSTTSSCRTFEKRRCSKSASDKSTNDIVYAIPKSTSFGVHSISKSTVALPHRLVSEKRTSSKKRTRRRKANIKSLKCESKTHTEERPRANSFNASIYNKENRYCPLEEKFYA